MNIAAGELPTLFELLARHWTAGAGVDHIAFDSLQDTIGFELSNGNIALARMADSEGPEKRQRVAADTGRTTISPRRKPLPPLIAVTAEAPLRCFAALKSGGWLAGSDSGALVHIVAGGDITATEWSPDGPIRAIASLADGGAIVATEHSVRTVDANGKALASVAGVMEPVDCLAVSPCNDLVAIAGNGQVRILPWSASAKSTVEITDIGNCRSLAWSPDSAWLAATLAQGGIAVIEIAAARVSLIDAYPSEVRSLSWSSDSSCLATSGAFRTIIWPVEELMKTEGRKSVQTGRAGLIAATAVSMCPDRLLVATGFANGMVVVAKIGDTGELAIKPPGDGAVMALEWSKTGAHLAFGTQGGLAALVSFPDNFFK